MNVKKYRATTTREALEQVKQDLGDDAFVLETKQVSSGGFIGLRSRKQVGISAASAELADRPGDFFKKPSQGNNGGLRITDDSCAAPRQRPVVESGSRDKILNALAVRAAAANE